MTSPEPYGTAELGPLLRAAAARLDAAGVEAAWNDARILAAHALEIDPADLVRSSTCTTEQAPLAIYSRKCRIE